MNKEELKKQLDAYFDQHQNDVIEDICRLVRIKSDKGEEKPGMPYGEGPAEALKEATKLAEERGFKTKNYDNRVIAIDMNDGPQNLDILAHMDVVPVNPDGWKVTKPFEPKVVDGRLYGRGTADDKGPAMAALWAMKALKDLNVPMSKNCRLLLGSDEECGSSDIEVYYQKEKEAPMTFSPDADFPVINIEKGGIVGDISAKFERTKDTPRIISFQSGQKVNVVPDRAVCQIFGMRVGEVLNFVNFAQETTHCLYGAKDLGDCVTEITCEGTAAHASLPEKGNSALTGLLELLDMMPLADCDANYCIQQLAEAFPHGDTNGETIGIKQSDEISGEITVALTMLEADQDHMQAYFDARCPLCCTEENTVKPAVEYLRRHGLTMAENPMRPPHHVSGDSDFVRTLLDCYEYVSGKPGKCLAIGGGTYVHHLEHGVAFGPEMEGIETNMHGNDENFTLDVLFMSCKIYALSIAALCE